MRSQRVTNTDSSPTTPMFKKHQNELIILITLRNKRRVEELHEAIILVYERFHRESSQFFVGTLVLSLT